MSTATNKIKWFGNLLDWQREPDTGDHVTWHKGQSRRITKLTRRQAEEQRTHPGWHLFWPDEEDGRPGDLGPDVGPTLPYAYQMAEAWIVCPYDDMMSYPKLWLAIGGGGVGWGEHGAIYPRPGRGELALRRKDADVCVIRPVWSGEGAMTEVMRWEAFWPAGEPLAAGVTWRDLIDGLGIALSPAPVASSVASNPV